MAWITYNSLYVNKAQCNTLLIELRIINIHFLQVSLSGNKRKATHIPTGAEQLENIRELSWPIKSHLLNFDKLQNPHG